MIIYLSKYIVEISYRKYKVYIFVNDNIHYRNKQGVISNKCVDISTEYDTDMYSKMMIRESFNLGDQYYSNMKNYIIINTMLYIEYYLLNYYE